MTKVNPYIVIPLEHTILFLPKNFSTELLNLKCLFYDEVKRESVSKTINMKYALGASINAIGSYVCIQMWCGPMHSHILQCESAMPKICFLKQKS